MLVVADTWEADAFLCVYILYEAAAVEACWAGAAPYIRDTEVLQCVVDDLSTNGVVWYGDWWLWFWLFRLLWLRLWGWHGVNVWNSDVWLLWLWLWSRYLIGL